MLKRRVDEKLHSFKGCCQSNTMRRYICVTVVYRLKLIHTLKELIWTNKMEGVK